MFGDMFGNEEEEAHDASVAQKSTYYRTRAANCAAAMDLPPQARQASNLVGLLNQGATCYLNSLFQTLHMTP